MSTDVTAQSEDPVRADVVEQAQEPTQRPSEASPIANDNNAEVSHSDVPAPTEERTIQPETPTETHQDDPAADQTPPKLNPGATEFISRSSSTGPGAEGIAGPKTNALGQSRHAGGRGGQPRRGRQSVPNSRPSSGPTNGSPSAAAVGNPVVLADPVGEGGVDVASMTGFKPARAVREPRPPRGYVPPAPERKTRLTAEELEEKMAKMRLLNEKTQAEQEARNADAQAYESQVSADRERAIAERHRLKTEAEAKSKRTQAVQSSINTQREQFRLRKLKLLESQGGLEPSQGRTDDERDSFRGFGNREARPHERDGGAGAGYGGYGYRGGYMGARGGYAGGRQLYDSPENGERRDGEEPRGSGRGDYRGRGRGQGGPARGGRQAGSQASGAVKAQQVAVPDTRDDGAFPALGDGKTAKREEKDETTMETKLEPNATLEATSGPRE